MNLVDPPGRFVAQLQFGSASIRSAAREAVDMRADSAALARGLYIDLMVSRAGEAAERLAGYPEPQSPSDSDLTINCAWRLARIETGLPMELGPDEPRKLHPVDPLLTAVLAIIERAEAETDAMLKDNWQAVVCVAGALNYHHRLTLMDLDSIIAHG